jgi:hypothetical protein
VSKPEPTAKQRLALAEMVTRARDEHGVESMPDWSESHPWWLTTYRDETRPGRGHDMDTVLCTGDHFVQITLDPYGSGSLSVAAIDWIHSDSDDECDCDECVRLNA